MLSPLADTVAEKVTHPAGNPSLLLPFLTKPEPPSNQLTQEEIFQGAGGFRSPLRLTREDRFISVLNRNSG
jgi:hypothetical protein